MASSPTAAGHMVKAKPKGAKAQRRPWAWWCWMAVLGGAGDPKLVGVGGGLAALLAVGIGANLMQTNGTPEAPPSMHEGRIASLPSRRNETPSFPERGPETLPAVKPQAADAMPPKAAGITPPQAAGVKPQAADVTPQLAAGLASQRTGELANTHPDHGECMRWAAGGQCQSNPVFMLASCLLGCSTEDSLTLHIASRSGNAEAVGVLLQAGAAVEVTDSVTRRCTARHSTGKPQL